MKMLILQFASTFIIWGLFPICAYCDSTPGWGSVSTILANIVPPAFTNSDYTITNYGAVGDGVTDCTYAFAKAITACSSAVWRAGCGSRGKFFNRSH